MPKNYRLSRVDFSHTRSFKRLNHAVFWILYGTIPGRTSPGGACVISGKVAKSAVVRNRVRRAAREALMDILRASPTPIVLVVIGKKGIDKLSNRELREHITALSTRVQ